MKIHSMSICIPAAPGTPLCNAACPFCISRLTGAAEKWDTGRLSWKDRFKKACYFSKHNGVNTLLVTGKGEPFLNMADTEAALKIGSGFFSIMEIQTNGSLCSDENLERLQDNGLTTLAISISHPDPVKNAALINLPEVVNYREITERASAMGLVVRISFNISRAWNSADETYIGAIEKIINDTSIPANQYTFRVISKPPATKTPEYSKIASWIDEFHLSDNDLEEVHTLIKKQGMFIRRLNWGASIYDVNGYSIAVADCLQRPGYSEDEVRSVIFMTDGHVYTSWEARGSILF
jgi:hypothetical protein